MKHENSTPRYDQFGKFRIRHGPPLSRAKLSCPQRSPALPHPAHRDMSRGPEKTAGRKPGLGIEEGMHPDEVHEPTTPGIQSTAEIKVCPTENLALSGAQVAQPAEEVA